MRGGVHHIDYLRIAVTMLIGVFVILRRGRIPFKVALNGFLVAAGRLLNYSSLWTLLDFYLRLKLERQRDSVTDSLI